MINVTPLSRHEAASSASWTSDGCAAAVQPSRTASRASSSPAFLKAVADGAQKRDVGEPGEKGGKRPLGRWSPQHVDEHVGVAGEFHGARVLALVEEVRESARATQGTHAADEPTPEGDLVERRVDRLGLRGRLQ